MKNVLFAVLFLGGAFAAQPGLAHSWLVYPREYDGWIKDEICPVFPLQVAVWPSKEFRGQLCSGKVEILGASVGLFGVIQESSIVSLALWGNGLTKNYLFQSAPGINLAKVNYGVQTAFFNVSPNEVDSAWNGVQLGCINAGGSLQLGCLNAGAGKFNDAFSLQAGLFNSTAFGFQVGAFNWGKDGTAQVGVFNYGLKGSVFQFGLLNYNEHGILPWMPLFNFSLVR